MAFNFGGTFGNPQGGMSKFGGFSDAGFQGQRQGWMPDPNAAGSPGQMAMGGIQDFYNRQAAGKQHEYQSGLLGQQQAGEGQLQAGKFAGEGALQAGQLASQERIAGGQQTGETDRARIAAEAAKYPALLKSQEFQQLFPLLSGQLGQLDGQLNASSAPGAGGPGSGGPQINVGGVLSNGQIQQQVNAQRAQNDATAGNQMRQNASNLAGRGFANNSPLLQLLNQNASMQAMGTNADTERQTRLDSAKMNASHLLGTQQANEQQYANRQQESIARSGQLVQQRSAILSALAGMI